MAAGAMRKKISLKTRRPGLSHAAFREHYEDRHVPLGLAYVDRFRWRRYVRNYVLDQRGAPVGFDAYTEFWIDPDADEEALARFVASPEFHGLHADDRRFLDVDARFSCDVVEIPLDPGARDAADAGPVSKLTLLWRSEPVAASEAVGLVHRITAPVADQLVAASLDRVLEPPATAPFDHLLTLRLASAGAGASALDASAIPWERWSLLTVEPVETPASKLYGAGDSLAAAERSS